MRLSSIILLAGLLAAQSFATHAEVYKWVDEKGKVHFGDKPPSKDARKVDIKPPPPGANTTSGAAPSNQQDMQKLQEGLLRGYAERKALEKEEQAKQKAERAAKLKECEKYRGEYNDYDGYRRYDVDKDGNKVYLSDERISQDKAALKKWLDKNC